MTVVATGCGESRRRCEEVWGQPGARTLGIPSPSFPEAVVASEPASAGVAFVPDT